MSPLLNWKMREHTLLFQSGRGESLLDGGACITDELDGHNITNAPPYMHACIAGQLKSPLLLSLDSLLNNKENLVFTVIRLKKDP